MRVGLVGCGNWGKYILRDLQELGCEVTVVTSVRAGWQRARRRGWDRRRDADEDALPAISEEALEHGVPVFVEKPLTDDPDDAERLARLRPTGSS